MAVAMAAATKNIAPLRTVAPPTWDPTTELEELGFVVTGILGSPSLPVLATDPPAGETHLPGTEIVIATELNEP